MMITKLYIVATLSFWTESKTLPEFRFAKVQLHS